MAEAYTIQKVRLTSTTETQLVDNATNVETEVLSITFHNDSAVDALEVDVWITDGSEGSGGAATAEDKVFRILLNARDSYVLSQTYTLSADHSQIRVAKTAGTDAINIHAETVVYS